MTRNISAALSSQMCLKIIETIAKLCHKQILMSCVHINQLLWIDIKLTKRRILSLTHVYLNSFNTKFNVLSNKA